MKDKVKYYDKEMFKQEKNIEIIIVLICVFLIGVIAEMVSDEPKYRKEIKRICYREGLVETKALVEELEKLQMRKINTDNLKISNRCHIILPYHILQDRLEEEKKGENKIGTTIKGIGPAYMDKAARIGIRMADLLDKEEFYEKLKMNLENKNDMFEKIYGAERLNLEEIFEAYYAYGQKLKQYVCDTSIVLNEANQR